MVRIGTVSRLGPTQVRSTRRKPVSEPDAAPEPAETAAQALVVIDGGRSEGEPEGRPADRAGQGRPRAGFVAQLLTADDPTLLPSRLTRTQMAAARYAEAARRLA
ncbi:hypothetical protein MCBMB27_04558 [Methylobacterium phyllosphaerae]|uniref:Uncharacterized protein n=1 Tax=Methylobacterium phyllosphaerae TaxID=418223 RepID=A0AAE8HWY5_9HYPH|nr:MULTISPECIES: hypothetical protein [Methylobacterium]APT33849.1 hypothetical protein MCBMB27_04558 [Methylobacterium phyllosphaerae]SFH56422.1 hypothetical protein SAMN05192567_13229 [Methylobacterium phyllosphaerae]